MSKLVLFLSVAVSFIFPFFSFASTEVLTCTSTTKASVKNLRAVRHHYGYEPQWLDAEIKTRRFGKTQKLSLTPLYMNGKYVLKDTWGSLQKASFILDLGAFKGPGRYSRVQAVRFKGDSNEEHFEMACSLAGEVPFVNACEDDIEEKVFAASLKRSADLLDMVLSCHTNVNMKNEKGCTPLMLVADRDCGSGRFDRFNHFAPAERPLESLINSGANIQEVDPATEEAALNKFVRYQDELVVQYLLAKNANVDVRDIEGFSPLMRAAEARHLKMVQLLLAHKADLTLKNKNGETAYDIARAKGDQRIMELLKDGGQEIVIQGKSDGTCLPGMIHVMQGAVAKLVLKAERKMILFEAKDLGLELMAAPNGSDSKNYTFNKKGTFPFTCGEHGGSNPTRGSIMVM